jgi:WD40 repeat protein
MASSIGIFIFDASSLNLEKHIDTRSWVTALEFSPDSQALVSGDRGGLIQLWSTTTWDETSAPFSGHTKSILDLAFSPDGTNLASIALDNTLLVWKIDSADQKPLRVEVSGGVTAVAYSSDNTRIVTGGNDLLINIWDASNLTFLQKKDFSSKIVNIASFKGSNVFVIGGSEQEIALLDMSNEVTLRKVGELQYPLTDVAVSHDGKLVAAGDINGGIAVWDVSSDRARASWKSKIITFEENANLDDPGSPHSLAFNPDGTVLFSGLHNGTLRSFDVSTGTQKEINPLFNAHSEKMAVSHNSQYLLTQQNENQLTVWDLFSGKPRTRQFNGQIMPGNPFTPDDSTIALGSIDPGPAMIKVINLNDGNELFTPRSQRGLQALQFTADGKRLAAVYDKFSDIWSMVNRQEQDIKRDFDGSGCYAIKDISGQDVVSTTQYGYVVAESQNKPGLCVFDPTEDWIYTVNELKGLIVYGGNRVLAIDNARTSERESLALSGVSQKNIVSIAINPLGELIAAAYDDHTIHIWNVATRDELTDFSGLYGHGNSITDLEFTPDGKLLISTSLDGTIRLWGVPY